MTEIQIFNNSEFGQLRTLTVQNEPWFVGKDVARVLGYGEGKSTTNAVAKHVDDEDKGVTELMTPGGIQPTTIINESGLYSLILSSKLPGAKKFKRWVTGEVLPAIRKNGGYIAGQEELSDAELMARAVLTAQKTIEEREKRIRELSEQADIMRPKALFADSVAASSNTLLVGELAKILRQNGVDMGEKRLFRWMRDNGFLIKRKGTDYNMPTQRSVEMGLFRIKETVVSHSDGHTSVNKTPKITGKGQQYFINMLIGNGGKAAAGGCL